MSSTRQTHLWVDDTQLHVRRLMRQNSVPTSIASKDNKKRERLERVQLFKKEFYEHIKEIRIPSKAHQYKSYGPLFPNLILHLPYNQENCKVHNMLIKAEYCVGTTVRL